MSRQRPCCHTDAFHVISARTICKSLAFCLQPNATTVQLHGAQEVIDFYLRTTLQPPNVARCMPFTGNTFSLSLSGCPFDSHSDLGRHILYIVCSDCVACSMVTRPCHAEYAGNSTNAALHAHGTTSDLFHGKWSLFSAARKCIANTHRCTRLRHGHRLCTVYIEGNNNAKEPRSSMLSHCHLPLNF